MIVKMNVRNMELLMGKLMWWVENKGWSGGEEKGTRTEVQFDRLDMGFDLLRMKL